VIERHSPSFRLVLILSLALRFGAPAESPLGPDAALKSFELADPTLTVEIVAAEPLVQSPCAMAFDEHGRLFVAENRGYPSQADPPQGTIAMLEDTDADGRMDKRTVFADGLAFPNGVLPWKGGLFVTCAPHVLYLKDSDGDGRADERRVVLTGFDTKGSTQLRVNAPLLGRDGWIWLASGLSGGRIRNPARADLPALDLKADLRFHPETGEFAQVDGRSQFGHSFDDFGRRFICMNRIQVQHVVLESRWLRRNPHLAFSETVQNCPELVPNPLLRGGGGAARIFPISQNVTTADSHAGTFSAACAVTIWKGGALPESYRGAAFSCDPTGNLVHVDKLEPRGATFAAVPMFEGREFLASRDDWFRPVFLTSGPDGALYIADMYRKVIEHPDYLPEEIRKRTEFDSGREMGRIWRVRGKSGSNTRPRQPALSPRAHLERLVDKSGWERDSSFRQLVSEVSPALLPLIAELFATHGHAEGAAAYLWLADILCARAANVGADLPEPLLGIEPPIQHRSVLERMVWQAFGSARPSVRATALALHRAEVRYPYSSTATHPWSLCKDDDAGVRLSFALHADVSGNREAGTALMEIVRRGIDDKWTRAAVLSTGQFDSLSFAMSLVSRSTQPGEDELSFFEQAARIAGGRDRAAGRLTEPEMLAGIHEGKCDPAIPEAFVAGYAEGAGLQFSGPRGALHALLTRAAAVAPEERNSPGRRTRAILLLARAHPDLSREALLVAAGAKHGAVSTAAIRALLAHEDLSLGAELLRRDRWAGWMPAQQEAIVSAFSSAPRHVPSLLAALESGAVPIAAVGAASRQQLSKSTNPAIRDRAEKLFPSAPAGDRMKAFETAKAALALKPQPANGRELFKKLCASCHRLDREGFAVGPDLFDIRRQPKESILLHIVAPEHEIAPGFAAYAVEMKDGRTLLGIAASETPESLTLRMPLAVEETILRKDVAKLEASPVSLMPPGLEQAISPQELADLLAYLKGE